MRDYEVTSFYKFVPIEESVLPSRKLALESVSRREDLNGLVILAPEGCNGTVSGSAEGLERFRIALYTFFGSSEWSFKDSRATKDPFPRFKVRIRKEIVTSGDPQIRPSGSFHRHLSPAEWQAYLESGEEIVVLDTRNRYETALGTFEGAIVPDIQNFQELPAFLDRANLPHDKPILMYCTGGIRCEKAILEMERRGFENVYQLDGGILRYLEQFPFRSFTGECFVFDGRVALDQQLRPTTEWSLCPHCGDPGREWIECVVCGKAARICSTCLPEAGRRTCSHDCTYRASFRARTATG